MTDEERIEYLRDRACRAALLLAHLKGLVEQLRGHALPSTVKVRVVEAEKLLAHVAEARGRNLGKRAEPFLADFGCGPGVDPEEAMNRPPKAALGSDGE